MRQATRSLVIKSVLLCFLTLLGFNLMGQEAGQVPAPVDFVTDLAEIISDSNEKQLNEELLKIQTEAGLSAFVLIVESTNSIPIDEYGQQILAAWGIDEKSLQEKTFLFLLAVKDGAYRLITTAGVEGILTDEKLEKISKETIIPRFEQGRLERGTVEGLNEVIKVYVEGLQESQPPVHRSSGQGNRLLGIDLMGILMILGLLAALAILNYIAK